MSFSRGYECDVATCVKCKPSKWVGTRVGTQTKVEVYAVTPKLDVIPMALVDADIGATLGSLMSVQAPGWKM